MELAVWCPCPPHFDKKWCLRRMDLNSLHVLLNGYLENVFATSMPEAKRWCSQLRRKPIQVRPITLAIASCQMEQIEFVFLRWLVGALNSVLASLLIKAVKANLFSCEPRRLRSASRRHYIRTYTALSDQWKCIAALHQMMTLFLRVKVTQQALIWSFAGSKRFRHLCWN